MLTAAQWWNIVDNYGAKIFPAQIVFYLLALALVLWCYLKPGRIQSMLIKAYLFSAFAWIGIVFFMLLANGITGENYGGYFFGVIFCVVAVLFAWDILRGKMQFAFPADGWRRTATLILMTLVFLYPLIGAALGHPYSSLIMPGTMPCPTAAFALLLLAAALPRANKIIYILLLLWAIPFPPTMQIPKYGVYEDAILFVVGIYSLVLLVLSWRTNRSTTATV